MANTSLNGSEENLAIWLDQMLNASIDGDYKEVKRLAKLIHKQAREDKTLLQN